MVLLHLHINLNADDDDDDDDDKKKNNLYILLQGTKIFQYYTCPAGRVTYNFRSSCKHIHLSIKSVCNKEHKYDFLE